MGFLSSKKFWLVLILISFLALAGYGSYFYLKVKNHDLTVINQVVKALPIEDFRKKEAEVSANLATILSKEDDKEWKFLVLLQNNLELRPGGGFVGQYGIVTMKNGKITKFFTEDANLLDKRIIAKVTPPYGIRRLLQIKKWKFRDGNFSPDFPTNVEKLEYFYRLSGGRETFDGVVAINASVLNMVLELTGPITVAGYSGEYNSENAILQLEKQVELNFRYQGIYIENRKKIIQKLTDEIVARANQFNPLKKLDAIKMLEKALRQKDIQIYFKDQNLQKQIEEVYWAGKVNRDWNRDYLMIVDANLGALKSDYWMRRSYDYTVDLSKEQPEATVQIKYNHTAPYGDWMTSDYHDYLRIYIPKGSELIERKMVSYPLEGEEFNKKEIGFVFHALIGQETTAIIKYKLPQSIKEGTYNLLIQKQSGVGNVPTNIHIIDKNGNQKDYSTILEGDYVLMDNVR